MAEKDDKSMLSAGVVPSSSSVSMDLDPASSSSDLSAASPPTEFVPIPSTVQSVVPIASEKGCSASASSCSKESVSAAAASATTVQPVVPVASSPTTPRHAVEAPSDQQSVCPPEASAMSGKKGTADAEALYQAGLGFKKQSLVEEAFTHFLQAAKLNHPAAQYEVAFAYRHKKGVVRSPDQAVKYLELAAEGRLPVAQHMYAMHLQNTESTAAAVPWFTKAAQQGYAEAQFRLGELSRRGVEGVVRRSATNAVHWYRKAARPRGANKPPYAPALHRLGIAHRDGHGAQQSTQLAFNNFQLATSQKHVESMCELGILSLAMDLTRGMQLLGAAAEGGYARAQYQLGLVYAQMLKPPQPDVAQKWFDKAQAQGYLRACQCTARVCLATYDEFDPPHERCLTDDWLAPDERDTGSDNDE